VEIWNPGAIQIGPGQVTGLTPQQVLFGSAAGSIEQSASLLFDTAAARQTVTRARVTETSSANTASTERVGLEVQQTAQFATGALATQRATLFGAPTYSFVAASVITNAATVAIAGAPIAGTNATITNPYSFWVQAGNSRFDGTVSCPGAGGNAERFGIGATAAGAFSAALGGFSVASASGSTALGNSANSGHTNSVALGFTSATTAANQCVIGGLGSAGRHVSNLFISAPLDTSPQGATINASGGSGSNVAGASLTMAGGRNTGNANPGALIFATGTPGASGSTLSALTERARITHNTNFLLGTTAENSAVNNLVLSSVGFNGPSATGTNFYIGCIDDGGGNVALSLYSSEAVGPSVAAPANIRRYRVWINGGFQNLLLEG